MKLSKNIWYYLSIVVIAFSLGVIIYGIATGETFVLGKFVLLLGISVYFFIKERKARRERQWQERLGELPELDSNHEEEKPPKASV